MGISRTELKSIMLDFSCKKLPFEAVFSEFYYEVYHYLAPNSFKKCPFVKKIGHLIKKFYFSIIAI